MGVGSQKATRRSSRQEVVRRDRQGAARHWRAGAGSQGAARRSSRQEVVRMGRQGVARALRAGAGGQEAARLSCLLGTTLSSRLPR